MFKNLAIKGRFAALAAMLMASGTNWADRKHVSMSRKRDFPNTYHFWQGQNFQERNYKRTAKDEAKIDAAIAKRQRVGFKRSNSYRCCVLENPTRTWKSNLDALPALARSVAEARVMNDSHQPT